MLFPSVCIHFYNLLQNYNMIRPVFFFERPPRNKLDDRRTRWPGKSNKKWAEIIATASIHIISCTNSSSYLMYHVEYFQIWYPQLMNIKLQVSLGFHDMFDWSNTVFCFGNPLTNLPANLGCWTHNSSIKEMYENVAINSPSSNPIIYIMEMNEETVYVYL